jgi:hypothetical protein
MKSSGSSSPAIELQIDELVLTGSAFGGIGRTQLEKALHGELAQLLDQPEVRDALAQAQRGGVAQLHLPPLSIQPPLSAARLGTDLATRLVQGVLGHVAKSPSGGALTKVAASSKAASSVHEKGAR